MPIGPRDYKLSTIIKLYSLARNECSFPTCTQQFSSEDRDDRIANICHIEGAEDGSARYDPKMTDDQRRNYQNLIVLCPNHHIETNDEDKYTVEVLKKMKLTHHLKMQEKYSRGNPLAERYSYLIEVINQIGSSDFFSSSDLPETPVSFDIETKIAYNSVKRYEPIIREYGVFQGRLTQLYTEIEQQGSLKKDLLLQNIKGVYLKAQIKILDGNNSIEHIQERADDLIEEVENNLWEFIERRSGDLNESVPYELINPCLSVVIVDAFMRCKILEEPPKNVD